MVYDASLIHPTRYALNPEQLTRVIQSMVSEVTILSPRQPGLLTGQLGDAFFEPLPEEELSAWES